MTVRGQRPMYVTIARRGRVRGWGAQGPVAGETGRVSGVEEPQVVTAVRKTLDASNIIASVVLGGSRARGTATDLSDWDLYLNGEPDRIMAEVPALVAPLRPLAAFWEPLSEEAGYMTVMDGPVKVDLFPVGAIRQVQPPWVPSPNTLPAIDAHFWDWILWLGSKTLRGERQLVADELAKMHWFLLGPLGAAVPTSLSEAVASYRGAVVAASKALGVVVGPELGRQVSQALHRHGLLAAV